MMTRRASFTLPLLAPLAASSLMTSCAHDPAPAEGQHPLTIALPGREEVLRLWLYLPPGYAASRQPWPLVVFLHGSGERGDELARVKVHGPPRHVDRGNAYPFVLASPQLAEGRRWEPTTLHALVLDLQARLRVDPERICATGLSLGGHGVWVWAAAYPRDLAAIVPVCGFGRPGDVCRARQVPVRAYHGEVDPVVPLARQQACVDALRACGGTVDFIVYPGVGHAAWDPAYEDPALVPWLMQQRRAQGRRAT